MKEIKQHLLTARISINKALKLLEPLPPPPERDERLRFGGTFFLWFLTQAWLKKNEVGAKAEALKVLNKFASYGFAVDESAGCWIRSGEPEHRHLDGKIPWKIVHSSVVLKEFEPRYFHLLREFIKLHKQVGIEFEYCITMRNGYIENAIPNVLDEDYWKYFKWLSANVCRMYRDVHGVNYKPRIKIANELAHGGSTDKFHAIGRLHRDIANFMMNGDQFVDSHTTIDRIKVDLSKSEGGQIYLNEPLKCGKCGQIHGDTRFNRKDPKNSILPEKHHFGCVKNITEDPDADRWLSSRWKRYEFSGDGGAHPYGKKGFYIPGTNFFQCDAEETGELVKYYMQRCKEKNKQGIFCLWLMEIYSEKTAANQNWREHWEYDIIDWDRVEACQKACKEIK